jgi:hypothetical protein
MNLTGQVILVLLFIAIVFYNFRQAARVPEAFSATDINIQSLTSVDLYQKNKGAMCDTLYYGSQFLTDANDLFQARYCLNFKDPKATEMDYDYMTRFKDYLTEQMGVYIQSAPLETFETDSLRQLVRNKLFYFKLSNGDDERPIQGPVFAVITQAPYMIDDKGDVIYHQPFNRDDYSFAPAFAVGRPEDTPPKNGLRIYVHLVYLMYNTKREVVDTKATTFDFKDYFTEKMAAIRGLKVDNSLCNIRCIGDGIRGLICGCVNQTKPYLSRCLGTDENTPAALQNTNQLTDYMMLYRIQENASQVADLFSATYFEDVKI